MLRQTAAGSWSGLTPLILGDGAQRVVETAQGSNTGARVQFRLQTTNLLHRDQARQA